MKKQLELLALFLFTSPLLFGQENNSMSRLELDNIAQVNQGNSYITFPTDIGNIEALWFEANISPNFYIRRSKNARFMGVLTPQVIIRMFQEASFPVRTPSYMPKITLYYLLNKKTNSQDISLYGRVSHHSNGQENNFFLEDGEINLKSGNFATNSFEFGFIKTNINKHFNAYQFFKTSVEFFPIPFIQDELNGIYGRYQWHSTFSIFKLPAEKSQSKIKKPTISIRGETTWRFGNYNHLNSLSIERLTLALTFYYHPQFLEDIGLFIQYYQGSDYYNIYFSHQLTILRFGLMTEKLRF